MVWQSLTTKSNMADELPGVALITTGINLNESLAEIGGDAATRNEDGALGEFPELAGKLVEKRLVSKTPVVLGVLDLGDLLPGLAAVLTLHDREPHVGRLGGVVLPGGQKGTVRQLEGTRVEDLRILVVGGRIKDLNVAESLSLLSRLCCHEGQQERNNGGETHDEDLAVVDNGRLLKPR
jgi:hypothetical protein